MMDVVPTPPGLLSGIDLKGPYDVDISAVQIDQIKRAGLMADWAVPYIFLSVAGRFESDGDEKRSVAFYDRAVREFRKRGNVFGEGTAWRRKMAALQRFGNSPDILKSITEMEVKTSGTPLAAFVSYSFGHYHAQCGNYNKALEYFRRALDVNSNVAGNPDLVALKRDSEMEYGMALISADYFPAVAGRLFLTDFDETFYRDIRRRAFSSLSYLESARSLSGELSRAAVVRYYPEITPQYLECDIQNYLGLAFGIQGETDKAVSLLEKAGAIARHAGYHSGKADNVFFLNQVYLLNKDTTGGKQAAYSLENIADQYQLLPYAVWSKIILAHHNRRSGDIDSALKFIQEFSDLNEKNGSWLSRISDFRGTSHFKSRFLRDAVFDLFIQKGDIQSAFQTAERIKAADLSEMFRTVAWREDSAETQWINKLRVNREQAAGIYRRLISAVNAPPVFLKTVQEAKHIQKESLNVISDMKNQHERLYHLMCGDSPRAQDLQRQLDQNTTLFSYYSTERMLHVWVISQNGIHMERIKISGGDIERFVRNYHQALIVNDRSQMDALAEKAYEDFLKPVIPFIHGDRVVLIPHGALYRFPFATMRYMKSYLVDVFSIAYLPHGGMLSQPAIKRAVPLSRKSLIIATPQSDRDVSTVRTDAEDGALKRIYSRADQIAPSENPREAVMKLSGDYDVIRFEAKCYLADSLPVDSGFLLSSTAKQGGYLTVSDLFGLSVKGRISFVSACFEEKTTSSSAGSQAAVVSSLMYSATRTVLMPLWSVDEKSRVAFTEYFHKYYEKNEDIADALKEAQNEMIRAGFSPRDWAAFILFARN
ncbi:MAG TPA: CHAT domain-containing protein [Smithellaceae bacterium]|nr:CHAT domain-containing protein [Smithellaceae bacterium]